MPNKVTGSYLRTGHNIKSYYYNIDVVRFLAALMVTSFHLCYLTPKLNFTLLWPFTWFGWVGVEVFFVISGVVIANSANGTSADRFLIGRALRLYPSAWICATITLLVSGLSGETNLWLPYIHSMALSPHGPWISSVYWTLAVEICFYFLIFMLLILRQFRNINWLAAALACISFSYLSMVTFGFVNELDSFNVLLMRHGCMFALGIWIWLSTVRRLALWERVGVALAVLSTIAEIRLTGVKFMPREFLGGAHILAPIVAWCVLICIIASSRLRAVSLRPAYSDWFRTLGLMTYPLYLVHDVLGQQVIHRLLGLGVEKWTALTAGIVSVVALSGVIVKLEVHVRSALGGVINWIGANLFMKWVAKRN